MKIKCCGYKTVIVEMTHQEFSGITGHSIGDEYGNGGYNWAKAEGKEFDLQKAIENIYSLRLASESKKKVISNLENMISKIDEAYFPLNEIINVEKTEVKS